MATSLGCDIDQAVATARATGYVVAIADAGEVIAEYLNAESGSVFGMALHSTVTAILRRVLDLAPTEEEEQG
jgi:hypothetical protein